LSEKVIISLPQSKSVLGVEKIWLKSKIIRKENLAKIGDTLDIGFIYLELEFVE
jgi:hypothetical protein